MCLELYSIDQPVQIAYEEEVIRFDSPFSATVFITALVRNTGYRDIAQLNGIYPHYLLRLITDLKTRQVRWGHDYFRDVTDSIPTHLPCLPPHTDSAGHKWLSMELSDPNYPLSGQAVTGRWEVDNVEFRLPQVLTNNLQRSNLYFRALQFTPFALVFKRVPIKPFEAHWLRFQVTVDRLGADLGETLFGKHVVFHEVVSPIDVRRTVLEGVQTALKDARLKQLPDDRIDEEVLTGILDSTGIQYERRVDLQYFELSIEPGLPTERLLMNWMHQGDLRMRSDSPRVRLVEGTDGNPANSVKEPVYQWKSGSALEPAHPWKNTGFSLRFGLFYSPRSGLLQHR